MESVAETKEESYLFWKNLILIVVFLVVTPLTLLTSLFSLVSINNSTKTLPEKNDQVLGKIAPSGYKVYASLPTDLPGISGEALASDARSEIIRQYLSKYASPLLPYADLIVSAADEHQIDFRLITAIAQKESNLCKVIPPGSYNCWGWGIHSEGTLGFRSFEEGIKTVTAGIAKDYVAKGYDTIEKIMSKYTPLSNGSWALGVNQFMSEME